MVSRARPRYQGPLQNLPMRIKKVTALAYLRQLEDQKIRKNKLRQNIFMERESRAEDKNDCTAKKKGVLPKI